MLHILSSAGFNGLKIGLLGGSFNPAHEGHRVSSLYALKRLGLDQVWWLASPQNPLKSAHGMASLERRLQDMRAIARHPKIRVTDIESQLGTRYTADTLKALRRRFPRTRFVWLMGADNLGQIPHWHEWKTIFHMVPVAVFRRPDYAAGRRVGKAAQRFDHAWQPIKNGKGFAQLKPPAWTMLDNRLNNLSATNIRKDPTKWRN